MAETGEKCYERCRSRRRGLQERLQHTVQRAHAALPRHGRAVLVLPVQQLGRQGAQPTRHQELSVAGQPSGERGAGQPSPGLRQLLQHGHVHGRRGWRWHGRRGGLGWRGWRRGAVPLHAAQPVQHVPRRALRRHVVVHRVVAAESQAALVGLWRRLRRRVAGGARGLGAAGGVPVRGRRGGAALRRGARPRRARGLLVAAAARAAARAARRPAPPARAPPALHAPVGLVRLARAHHAQAPSAARLYKRSITNPAIT